MNPELVLIIASVTLLAWSAIMYVIVKNATEAANKRALDLASVQSKVLMELALKMGVDPSNLDKAEDVRRDNSTFDY